MNQDTQTQLQQLQNDVVILKSRVFDANETLAVKTNELNQYISLVNELVKVLGLHDDGNGIQADTIVAAVKSAFPVQEAEAVEGELLQE